MNYLLGAHIVIATALLVAFAARYLAVLIWKRDPNRDRPLIVTLSLALVVSGVMLMIVDHAPITSACLTALAIIVVVSILEVALEKLGDKVLAR